MAGQPLARASEGSKIGVLSHSLSSLRRFNILPMDSVAISGEGKIETGLSRKDLWRNLVSSGTNFLGMHKRPAGFLSMSLPT